MIEITIGIDVSKDTLDQLPVTKTWTPTGFRRIAAAERTAIKCRSVWQGSSKLALKSSDFTGITNWLALSLSGGASFRMADRQSVGIRRSLLYRPVLPPCFHVLFGKAGSACKSLILMAHPRGFEPLTFAFGVRYRRNLRLFDHFCGMLKLYNKNRQLIAILA